MKKVFRVLLVLVVLLLAVVVVLNAKLGDIVKASVETFGPAALKVPVKLGSADFRLLRGHIELSGLQVGNPDGFKTESAFSLGRIKVLIEPKSLFTDTILIREILVEAPEITYERGLRSSNLSALMDGLASAGGPSEAKPETKAEETPDQAPAKKVVIEHVLVSGGQVNLSAGILGGAAIPVPLPRVELRDIGKDEGGALPADALIEVVKSVVGSAVGAAGAAVEMAGKGLKAVGGLAADASVKAADASKAAAGAVGDAAGVAAGAAGEAAGIVGDAAGTAVGAAGEAAGTVLKGAGAAAGAAGDAAKNLIGGAAGLLRGGKAQSEVPPAPDAQ